MKGRVRYDHLISVMSVMVFFLLFFFNKTFALRWKHMNAAAADLRQGYYLR